MNPSALGGSLILLLIVGALVIAYWQVILGVLILLMLVAAMVGLSEANVLAELRAVTRNAEQRLRGEACRIGDRYALIEGIGASNQEGSIRLTVLVAMISREDGHYVLIEAREHYQVPAEVRKLASHLAFTRHLASQGLEVINELSVEAKATKAAVACLREAEWADKSLEKLQELITSAQDTLAKASGNELLEPAIPRLEEALERFEIEQEKMLGYRDESRIMLRKLDDFLSVPETLRPILSFDLDSLYDPARLKELQDSFEEVVTINEAFTELSAQKLA